ncbi:4-hydroxyphenylpyruvate dioxygenase-like protein [Panulirus ornatus]|uniref:4-hydroxyphenylpyruvate dioxygenase-like protein n=1 Tax=Panulirus ornatus TaxID=150431 RepID=UPI003A846F93
MSCTVLHHVEMCVKDESKVLKLLVDGFGFHPIAYRVTPQALKWVLRSGNSVFIVTKRNYLGCNNENHSFNVRLAKEHDIASNSRNDILTDSGLQKMNDYMEQHQTRNHHNFQEPSKTQQQEHWSVFCCRDTTNHIIDSVFNVALVVKDVDVITKKIRSEGGQIIRGPANISDAFGHVRYSVVSPCCGNVIHTLIDTKNYKGNFLPGYEPVAKCYTNKTNGVEDEKHDMNCMTSCKTCDSPPVMQEIKLNEISEKLHLPNFSAPYDMNNILSCVKDKAPDTTMIPFTAYIDHVAIVCDAGKSSDLISWYERCFGMKRFITNSQESEEDGFVLGGDIGLRLKALEYWRCAETGLGPPSATTDEFSLKLVIAEALPEVSKSHVNTFLQAHRGPGVQHIALHTQTMTATVKCMSDNGVIFRKPPPVYYEEGIKLEEITEVGHGKEIEVFQKLGILLDTEADVFTNIDTKQEKKSYLMQVFTGPIFEEDTFFLEIIQRCGATGFGAGNITALAKSIILYKQQLENSGPRE